MVLLKTQDQCVYPKFSFMIGMKKTGPRISDDLNLPARTTPLLTHYGADFELCYLPTCPSPNVTMILSVCLAEADAEGPGLRWGTCVLFLVLVL